MSVPPDQPTSFRPTEGLSYDPEDPRYWDATLLRGEIERAFDLCNSCRLCFKYCDSFPTLFDLLDRKHGGDVKRDRRRRHRSRRRLVLPV